MPVRTKSIYDPAAPEDGARILITRYWPRGVRKTEVDRYVPAVAPSRELLRAIKHAGLSWTDYVPRYHEEMEAPNSLEAIGTLAAEARAGTVTLLCTCRTEQCHRTLLKDLIERRL